MARAGEIPAGCFAPNAIPAKWRELIFGIPGYDPTRGAKGCWFDPVAAQRALDFFPEMLVHIEGDMAGKPFVLALWQAAIVANLFGWFRRDSKGRVVRRYRELLVYVARKNGKTPLCAGIALYLFFCDVEAGQQGYVAAKNRDQAGHLYRQMEHMVRANAPMRSRCRMYGGQAPAGQTRSFVKPDASFLKVISGDGAGKHGGNPHIVLVDEVHEQRNRELIDTLQTSMVSENRTQSLIVWLTTADFDRPSICNEKYDEAVRVRDNPERDPSFLPVIFEADPKDDPYSPATWRKANPNLGISVSEHELARLATKAKDNPSFKPEFLRLHLNIRASRSVANAIDMAQWNACGAAIDVEKLRGRRCWGAIDFGWRDDYAALVLIFPNDDGTVDVLCFFWVPEDGKRNLKQMPAADFVAKKLVHVSSGSCVDVEDIYETLDMVRDTYELQFVGYDPNNARKQEQDLTRRGFRMKEFAQNKRNYSEPWKWLMAVGLAAKMLRHGGHAVLKWMAGNTAVEVDGVDGVMPKKTKSAEKIDGITALCMAIGVWLTDPDKDGNEPSVTIIGG